MDIIRGLCNLRPEHQGCVATIGNFDGVHRGHQAMLARLAEQGRALGLPVVVVTFEPQPQEFFARARALPRLTRLREKVVALRDNGADRVLVLRFDRHLADMAAEDFVARVLMQGLAPRYLVVGDDFRYGKDRTGDFALLQALGAARGCEVVRISTVDMNGLRVSSTRIREALAADDFVTAEKLLGRPYAMCGRVVHGDGRGRGIGFPTANVRLHRRVAPVAGVYCVSVHGLGEAPRPGVANVGTRPTVDGSRCQLEVHVLDFDGDLYGRYVQVDFLHKLRSEQRFGGLDELVAQIGRDVAAARAYFAGR